MPSILSYINFQKQWNSKEDIYHVICDLNESCSSIEILQFTGNTLGVKAAEELIEPLSRQHNLKVLYWNDLFTGRLKSEISVALKSLSLGLMRAKVNLVELDLSDNAFGPNGVIGVTELLASPYCYTLKVLNMNNQGLGHEGCRYLIDALKVARKNSDKQGMNLEVFIAGRNRLENTGMKMLAELFADGMNSLQTIVLLQNGIGVHGVDGVGDLILSIRNHVNLKILNISDNTIKPNGMKLLSKVLPCFGKLEEIYMSDCLISNSGLDCLTRILDEISYHLKIISLSGNEIKGKPAKNFISMLVQTKHSLEKVDLTENEINLSYKNEIKDIVKEHDKSHILVEEDENNNDDSEEETDDSGEDSDTFESEENESNGSLQESEHSERENEFHKNPIYSTKNIFSNDNSSISSFRFTKNCQSESMNLFKSSQNSSCGNAGSNLFNLNSNQTNIFQSSLKAEIFENVDTNKKFSFLDAAKDSSNDITNLKRFIIDNLKSKSVMAIEHVLIVRSKNVDKNLVDFEICHLAKIRPENTVRVGLILCSQRTTFDIGLLLIDVVLTSNITWSQATNALLVEMNCIKSEEKNFIPFCQKNVEITIEVLKKILNTGSISNEVRLNLITVLKNLNKISNNEIDDLLKSLENSVDNVKI